MRSLSDIFKGNKGMTILELMITVTILSIVLAAAFTFLVFSQKQYIWVDTDQRNQDSMRMITQRMGINIRDASRVLLGSDTNGLQMRLPIIDVNGFPDADQWDIIVYMVNPANTSQLLMRTEQYDSSTSRGWGTELGEEYNAATGVTTNTWLVAEYLTNTDDHDRQPLFGYGITMDDTGLSYIESTSAVTVTLNVRRRSTPGKYQTSRMFSSERLRNKH